jgi:hypothetical protein
LERCQHRLLVASSSSLLSRNELHDRCDAREKHMRRDHWFTTDLRWLNESIARDRLLPFDIYNYPAPETTLPPNEPAVIDLSSSVTPPPIQSANTTTTSMNNTDTNSLSLGNNKPPPLTSLPQPGILSATVGGAVAGSLSSRSASPPAFAIMVTGPTASSGVTTLRAAGPGPGTAAIMTSTSSSSSNSSAAAVVASAFGSPSSGGSRGRAYHGTLQDSPLWDDYQPPAKYQPPSPKKGPPPVSTAALNGIHSTSLSTSNVPPSTTSTSTSTTTSTSSSSSSNSNTSTSTSSSSSSSSTSSSSSPSLTESTARYEHVEGKAYLSSDGMYVITLRGHVMEVRSKTCPPSSKSFVVQFSSFMFSCCLKTCIARIASFDMDGTLIKPKSGAKFPANAQDWK